MVDQIISDCLHFSDDFMDDIDSGEIVTKYYYEWSENEYPSLFKVSNFDPSCAAPGSNECCTSYNQCGEGLGDCDNDDDCTGSLKCGQGNGLDGNCADSFNGYDCCYEPEG